MAAIVTAIVMNLPGMTLQPLYTKRARFFSAFAMRDC